MYPSGRWKGYWECLGWGRQYMERLILRVADGKVDGEGVDVIGPFTFHGTYDEAGAVALVKQYIGRHQVVYRGTHDGEGTIFGRWSVGASWTGPFALRPERFTIPADAPILTIAAGPPLTGEEEAPTEGVEPLAQPWPARRRPSQN